MSSSPVHNHFVPSSNAFVAMSSTSSNATLNSSTPSTPVKSSPYSSRNTSKPTSPVALPILREGNLPPQHSHASPAWEPNYGDLVWVQTHSSFPYWYAFLYCPVSCTHLY
jgi:hypothetical protein